MVLARAIRATAATASSRVMPSDAQMRVMLAPSRNSGSILAVWGDWIGSAVSSSTSSSKHFSATSPVFGIGSPSAFDAAIFARFSRCDQAAKYGAVAGGAALAVGVR